MSDTSFKPNENTSNGFRGPQGTTFSIIGLQREKSRQLGTASEGPSRVSVACNRCRKRKIKCSGPSLANGSCSNCSKPEDAAGCYFGPVYSCQLGWSAPSETAQSEEPARVPRASRVVRCRQKKSAQNAIKVKQEQEKSLSSK